MSRGVRKSQDQDPFFVATVLASGDRSYRVIGMDAEFVQREAERARDWFLLQRRGKTVGRRAKR